MSVIFIELIKFFFYNFCLFTKIEALYLYFGIYFIFFNLKLSKVYKLVIISNICQFNFYS